MKSNFAEVAQQKIAEIEKLLESRPSITLGVSIGSIPGMMQLEITQAMIKNLEWKKDLQKAIVHTAEGGCPFRFYGIVPN
jgi:hypothetical protein